MRDKDDLQDLWQSHVASWPNRAVPDFSLLEDMTAPVQSPAELKWLNVAALAFAIVRVVVELQRIRSTPELIACSVALLFAVVGLVLLLRQTAPIAAAGHDCSVEEFRTQIASQYDRQARSFRRSFIPALLLTWASLLVSEALRDYVEKGTTGAGLILPCILVAAIPFAVRFQRSIDERAVRRILRGH